MYDLAAKTNSISSLPFWKRDVAKSLTADELQQRYLTAVLNYVVARIGAGAEAEDVTAEVFAAAFGSLSQCPAPAATDSSDDPARAYLFGIARRKLADFYRRRQRRPEIGLSADIAAPAENSPESHILASEASAHLRRILSEIPEFQAEVLRLKYVEGFSLAEIGIVVRKRPGAVAQLLHRARENARRRGVAYFGSDLSEEGTSHGL